MMYSHAGEGTLSLRRSSRTRLAVSNLPAPHTQQWWRLLLRDRRSRRKVSSSAKNGCIVSPVPGGLLSRRILATLRHGVGGRRGGCEARGGRPLLVGAVQGRGLPDVGVSGMHSLLTARLAIPRGRPATRHATRRTC